MQAISLLKNEDEAMQFFTDLCTPAELESMADSMASSSFATPGHPIQNDS
ncbi:Trp family transcriptional regulator [Legionella pneumophila]|nr:Trp family transcriptional regulator [Legionella pneumophila]